MKWSLSERPRVITIGKRCAVLSKWDDGSESLVWCDSLIEAIEFVAGRYRMFPWLTIKPSIGRLDDLDLCAIRQSVESACATMDRRLSGQRSRQDQDDNPYEAGSSDHDEWEKGWQQSEDEKVTDINPEEEHYKISPKDQKRYKREQRESDKVRKWNEDQ